MLIFVQLTSVGLNKATKDIHISSLYQNVIYQLGEGLSFFFDSR